MTKTQHPTRIVLSCSVILTLGVLCVSCTSQSKDRAASAPSDADGCPAGEPTLTISYEFGKVPGMTPSYQTAIWLEDENGQYEKTLYVSEYLSYCGDGYTTICPDWTKVAQWSEVSESELDAVTRATPRVGSNTLTVCCRKRNISPGVYRYCMQTHCVEDVNVQYQGKIVIGPTEAQNVATATDDVRMPPVVVGKVEAHYKPGETDPVNTGK